jgi:hypothetical protein
MFTLNMDGLHLRLFQFANLLKEILPDLTRHLDQHGIHPAMFASQWFLTLFAYVFPMELVDRIYDIVFAEGAAETIMRVAIAMLKQSEHVLLDTTEFEDILDFLTSRKLCEPYASSYNQVIHDAMSLSDIITKSKLDMLSNAYDTSTVVPTGKFSFWRKKSLKRSTSAQGPKPPAFKRWSSVSSPPKEYITDDDDVQKLKRELDELKQTHHKTLTELQETRYDKQCLENERVALKLTIQELENSPENSIYVSSLSTTMLTLSDDDEFSDRFVQLKVENFELEQKCEGLTYDLEHLQNKLDMLNEGQVALFDKFITMKSDMEELVAERHAKTEENARLQRENERLLLDLDRLKVSEDADARSITKEKRRSSIYGVVLNAFGKS